MRSFRSRKRAPARAARRRCSLWATSPSCVTGRHETTLGYLGEAADLVRRKTGLLPHLNPGLMSAEDYRRLRPVAPSMGLMLETSAERLSEPGGPHHGSPDKKPELRLQTIALAGEARVPFTTGLLIGIGETREERIEALLAINAL